MPADINVVCDYIIRRSNAANMPLNVLKLQKLLYYSQAWSLAFNEGPLFDGKFQAWIHGPVNRAIYDRFSETKSLYSSVLDADAGNLNPMNRLTEQQRARIESVLEVYGKFSGSELEAMTHKEDPWIRARNGLDRKSVV